MTYLFALLLVCGVIVSAQECPSGQVMSPISNQCANCTDFLTGCAACSIPTKCDSCKTNFNMSANGTCQAITECNLGDFMDANGNCQNCAGTLQNCAFCENGTTCAICKDGYNPSNGGCVQIQTTTCGAGEYYDIGQAKCLNCNDTMPNCDSCKSNSECTSCAVGFNLTDQGCNVSTPMQCGRDEYFDNSTERCYKCENALANCSECSDSATCSKCENGTTWVLGQCLPPEEICQPGTYLDSATNECKSCSSNCLICSSADQCNVCQNNTNPVGGLCQASRRFRRRLQDTVFGISGGALCPANFSYYIKGGDCRSCPGPCKACKEVKGTFVCITCDDDSYRDGYTCKRCDSSMCHCDTCLFNGFCTSCQDGYYSSSISECKPCRDAMLGCSKCASDSVCTACDPPYVLNKMTKRCECARPNCEYCIKEYAGCLKCKKGFYRDMSGKCFKCHQTCEECEDKGMSNCSKCGKNAILIGGKGSIGYCVCIPGYDWKNNACVPSP